MLLHSSSVWSEVSKCERGHEFNMHMQLSSKGTVALARNEDASIEQKGHSAHKVKNASKYYTDYFFHHLKSWFNTPWNTVN